MDKSEDAVRLFCDGHACSQAVLETYGPSLGLPEELAGRLASGFAGGMRMGGTCGAVTGALMVLGLRHCSGDGATAAARKEVYGQVVDFAERFRARHGSLACSELLGCDMSTPEGAAKARELGLFRTVCPQMVRDAAEILESMIAD